MAGTFSNRGRARTLISAVLLLLGGSPLAPLTAQGDLDDEARPAGHARMLADLAAIGEQAALNDPYLGSRPLTEFRGRVAAEGFADLPIVERIHTLRFAGLFEMRVGDIEASVERLGQAYELVQSDEDLAASRLSLLIAYDLAIANMRLGETRNCVAMHTSQSCILPIRGEGVHVDQTGSRDAMRYLTSVLEQAGGGDPAEVCSRWLLNIAAMTVGEHPRGFAQGAPDPQERARSGARLPALRGRRARARDQRDGRGRGRGRRGLLGRRSSGRDDDHLGRERTDAPVRRERGRRLHRPQPPRAVSRGLLGGLNLTHADYDGDGDVDALVLRGAWLQGAEGRHPNSLLRNDGTGSFRDVTHEAGLAEPAYPTQVGVWSDYDRDGHLDLFVGNEASSRSRFPSQLFRNRGDGTFVDVGEQAGITNMRYTKGASWGDYDGDGHPDLYVSNLRAWNRLYHNGGDGTFEDRAQELDVMAPYDSFATWFWDFDNDGDEDVFAATYFQGSLNASHDAFRLFPVVSAYLGLERQGVEGARLYRNDGNGKFEDVAEAMGIDRHVMTMGANYGDLDNDGWLDFFLGTGYPHFDGLIPNVMMHNLGGRAFEDVTRAGGFGHLQKGHGVAFADLDADGDQDVYEQMGGSYPTDAFGNVLFENPGNDNHWVKIDLTGVRSNRAGIGARVRVDFLDGTTRRSVYRTVTSGSSFGGNPFTVHVGLGAATSIETLEVLWPSGETQRFVELPIDRRLEILEGGAEVGVVEENARPFGNG